MLRTTLALLLLGFSTLAGAEPSPAPVTPPPVQDNAATSPEPGESGIATEEATEPAQDPNVPFIYLVARIKLTGTDLTQVAFFRHPAITTMEACEAERNAGLTAAGWQYFNRYFLRTLKGYSYTVDYRCVEGEQRLAYWRSGTPKGYFYLVRTDENLLRVQLFDNFFVCRNALGRKENIDAFCGLSAQQELPRNP